MANYEDIILTQTDLHKILAVTSLAPQALRSMLEEELSRASIVADDQLPPGVVAMNSFVTFEDVVESKQSMVTLVYPHEANIDENKISILTPIGSALIGLRTGQNIRWVLPNGKEKNLRIISVS